jgi:hypothetical protein
MCAGVPARVQRREDARFADAQRMYYETLSRKRQEESSRDFVPKGQEDSARGFNRENLSHQTNRPHKEHSKIGVMSQEVPDDSGQWAGHGDNSLGSLVLSLYPKR